MARVGKDNENGVRMAIDELNSRGVEIGGQRVRLQLDSEDDLWSADGAKDAARRLIDAGVVGVIGHLSSQCSIAASEIYAKANIPQVSPSSTNPDYTGRGLKTTFRMVANDNVQAVALASFVAGVIKAKRVAILDDQTKYGQELAGRFAEAINAKGVSIIARSSVEGHATDFSKELQEFKDFNPDIVFFGGMDVQAGLLIKQMKELGLNARLVGGDGMQTKEFIRLAGDSAEGQYASQPAAWTKQMPRYAEFEEKYNRKFHSDFILYSPYAYDATMVMLDAMRRAGSTDPEKYLPELKKEDYKGITGRICFDENGDIVESPLVIYQVKNSKWVVASAVTISGPMLPIQ